MAMVELYDTHAHFEGTAEETATALARAAAAGVTRVMAVGGSSALNAGVETAARVAKGIAVARAIGWDRDQVDVERTELDYTDVAAVGEIGLDYFYAPETRARQVALFSQQLELAHRLDKPVVIHTREADDDTLGVLREIPSKGIIHCFTGGLAFCRQLLDLGFMISYSGIVTFNRAENVRETARYVPDERILIETDSPFLAPVPMRGNPNEPAFIVHTAKFLAALRKTSFESFAAHTTANALKTLKSRS